VCKLHLFSDGRGDARQCLAFHMPRAPMVRRDPTIWLSTQHISRQGLWRYSPTLWVEPQ
jgi:hypothetical protein